MVDRIIHSFASILHCKVMVILFIYIYLGIHVVGNPQRISMWKPVTNKMQNKFSTWQRKTLLCLISSGLSTILLFFLFFHKVLGGVVKVCRGIMRFLGEENNDEE